MARNSSPTIAVDARPLSMPNTGIAIFTLSILEPLIAQGFAVTLVTNQPLQTTSPIVKKCEVAILPGSRRLWWEQVTLWRFLANNDFDLYFATWNYGVPALYRGRTKVVLALLDLIPLVMQEVYLPNPLRRWLYKAQVTASLRRASRITTISEASAKDIEKFFPSYSATAFLIQLPKNSPPSGVMQPYFVYLGGVDPRKQISKMIEGFSLFSNTHPDYKLFLLGRGYEVFIPLIDKLGLKNTVVMPGYVTDEDKFKYLSGATGLIFPSLYEGFGLPVAEAIISGVPSIAGDTPALREVGGNAALYVDPTQPKEIAAAMEKLLSKEQQQLLRRNAAKRKHTFQNPEVDKAVVRFFEDATNES